MRREVPGPCMRRGCKGARSSNVNAFYYLYPGSFGLWMMGKVTGLALGVTFVNSAWVLAVNKREFAAGEEGTTSSRVPTVSVSDPAILGPGRGGPGRYGPGRAVRAGSPSGREGAGDARYI